MENRASYFSTLFSSLKAICEKSSSAKHLFMLSLILCDLNVDTQVRDKWINWEMEKKKHKWKKSGRAQALNIFISSVPWYQDEEPTVEHTAPAWADLKVLHKN